MLLWLMLLLPVMAQDGSLLPGIPADLLDRHMETRDHDLYVSVPVLMQELEQTGVTFIDVRTQSAYGAAHIPGSLRLPLYRVKTKPFLKSRTVVLVDEGWGNVRLEEECRSLVSRGFSSIRILNGGINAWHRQGGDLQGAVVAGSTLAKIDAAAFWSTRRFDDWLVINPSTGSSDTIDTLIPESQRIPFIAANPEYFEQELLQLLEANADLQRLLIVTDTGTGTTAIRSCIASIPGITVFCLEGGRQALEKRLRIVGAMRNSTTQSTSDGATAPTGCATCP